MEKIHHFPGCMKELAQASRKNKTARQFRMINNRRVKVRSIAMSTPKLQIFFVSGSFQDLFFLIGQETVTLLVDLVKDLIDTLLRYIGDLLERLSAGNLIVKLVFRRASFFLLIGVEKIVAPIEKAVDPDTTVMAPAQPVDKEEPRSRSREVGDISGRIPVGNAGKIDQHI